MADLRDILEDALSSARRGELVRARESMEAGLTMAQKASDDKWIRSFARNAAAVCEQLDDLEAAEQYYKVALAKSPDDAYTYLALASLYEREQKTQLARQTLEECLTIASKSNDSDVLDLLAQRGVVRQP
jgi:tetratricopeptide (TPR) repeat protein